MVHFQKQLKYQIQKDFHSSNLFESKKNQHLEKNEEFFSKKKKDLLKKLKIAISNYLKLIIIDGKLPI